MEVRCPREVDPIRIATVSYTHLDVYKRQSWYYPLAGLAWLVAAVLMWRGRSSGAWLVIATAILTIPWALWLSLIYI